MAAFSRVLDGASKPAARCKPAPQPDELIYRSATKLAEMIRARQVSSREVVTAYIERIKAVHPRINAVTHLAEEQALKRAQAADEALSKGEARGSLHGVPVTVKDNCLVAGMVTTGGTLGRKGFVPDTDHPMAARLRKAGAVILGKTNCPELGLAHETDNLVYGRTSNPWDTARIPGGSTGGEAAIIATGGSPLGIGGDGGGSIRSPAHFCGIAGVKPTWGMVPCTTHGIVGGTAVGGFLVQGGPLARYAEDLALALPILAGPSPGDAFALPNPPLHDWKKVRLEHIRVAFYTDNGIMKPTPATEDTVRQAANRLGEITRNVDEKRPPRIEETYDLMAAVVLPGMAKAFEQALRQNGTKEVSPLLEQGMEVSRQYERAVPPIAPQERDTWWRTFSQTVTAFMSNCDVMLCPVNACPAMKHGTTWAQLKAFTYAMTYNLTGHPAAVVRCGTSPEGLPIGVQIVAQMFREDIVFAVAEYLERALGGWRPPPL